MAYRAAKLCMYAYSGQALHVCLLCWADLYDVLGGDDQIQGRSLVRLSRLMDDGVQTTLYGVLRRYIRPYDRIH